MAEVSAFRNAPRILPTQTQATPLSPPPTNAPIYRGTVAQYKDRVRFGIPKRIAEHFGNSGVTARCLSDSTWELAAINTKHPARIRYHEKEPYRFEAGIRTPPAIPLFGASPAEFVINGQQVLVTVKEKRAFTPKPRRNKKPWPKEKVIVTDASSQTFTFPLPPIEDRMRAALTEIRALEQQTTYRLRRIGDDKRWAWVAPTIE